MEFVQLSPEGSIAIAALLRSIQNMSIK